MKEEIAAEEADEDGVSEENGPAEADLRTLKAPPKPAVRNQIMRAADLAGNHDGPGTVTNGAVDAHPDALGFARTFRTFSKKDRKFWYKSPKPRSGPKALVLPPTSVFRAEISS